MASTELSLECKLQSYSMLLKYSFGNNGDQFQIQPPSPSPPPQPDQLQEFLSRLEEERHKIDVFKRELPLCMQLLTNAVETSRKQLQACKMTIETEQTTPPVFEEFIPLRISSTVPEDIQKPPIDAAVVSDNKANWMTSVQLWSQASDITKQQSDEPFKQRSINGGGAFLPFNNKELINNEKGMTEKADQNKIEICNKSGIGDGVLLVPSSAETADSVLTTTSSNTSSTTQTHRKARRCWSPDLHRRFVNALQMLGGSLVATPKQIRELMKVDGLTNDEVKSHLQKYRLHTRRPGPNSQAPGPGPGSHPAQLVVLGVGGIWVPPEYAAAQSGAAPRTLYGPPSTPHPHSHFYTATPSVAQEFYTTAPYQHQFRLYRGAGATSQPTQQTSPPELELRGESLEEDKCRSGSWRVGDSENGDEIRSGKGSPSGQRSEEFDDEESNRSEITLKFEKL